MASPTRPAVFATESLGRTFKLTKLGSLADLDAEIVSRQKAHPTNPMAWAALQYQRMMASGEGSLVLPVATSFITEPTTIHEYFSRLPTL